MSDSTSSTAQVTTKKPRSPVERAIVWGGILILLGIVAIEYVGYRAQRTALTALLEKVEAGDGSGPALHAAEVREIVGQDPVRDEDVAAKNLQTNAKRMEVYEWFTLSPVSKRALYVYYGTGGIEGEEGSEVINVTTSEDEDVYQHGKAYEEPKVSPPLPTE